MNNRLERLRTKLSESDLDAFFVSSPENRRYLSGFSGSAGFLIIGKDAAGLEIGPTPAARRDQLGL